MNNYFMPGFFLGALTASVIFTIGLMISNVCLKNDFEQQAINNGCAEYKVDDKGVVTFEWKNFNKEK